MEIIAVNDGSKDGTLAVLRDYETKHPSVMKVIDKPNGGVSSARNAGIEIAKGEYIMFVDADDRLVENSLSAVMDKVNEMDHPDVIYTGIQSAVRGVVVSAEDYRLIKPYGSNAELMSQILLTTFSNPWGKLFRRSVVEHNRIRFREDKRMYEDTFFNIEILKYTSSIKTVEIILYQYNMIPGSSSRRFFGEEIIATIEELRQQRQKYFIVENGMQSMVYDISRDAAFMYLFAIYSIYRSKGTAKKIHWLRRYWNSADNADPRWTRQLDSGIPRITGMLGRRSKFLCHIWLLSIFGAEKMKNRFKRK